MTRTQAIKEFREMGENYKVQIIEDLPEVTRYRYTDRVHGEIYAVALMCLAPAN